VVCIEEDWVVDGLVSARFIHSRSMRQGLGARLPKVIVRQDPLSPDYVTLAALEATKCMNPQSLFVLRSAYSTRRAGNCVLRCTSVTRASNGKHKEAPHSTTQAALSRPTALRLWYRPRGTIIYNIHEPSSRI
jgi:hypothetical protein